MWRCSTLKLQTLKGPGLVIPDDHLPSFAQIETAAKGHGRCGEDLAMVRSVASLGPLGRCS